MLNFFKIQIKLLHLGPNRWSTFRAVIIFSKKLKKVNYKFEKMLKFFSDSCFFGLVSVGSFNVFLKKNILYVILL